MERGAIGVEIDFSISFGFLYRWLVHFDARLFSLAFDVETGEFAPFIQGPPGAQRLLGGVSVAAVWAADLTLYGGCTYSTTFGWSCHASLCWSVVSAVDVVGQGYRIARKGCWFDEEWEGSSDSGQSHTFVTPGNCSTVSPCVTDENGVCVTDVEITDCCEESLDLITEGPILRSGGQPVIIPFQWTNAYFYGSEPPTPTHGVATVRGIPLGDGSCCGDGAVTGIERCDPPGSLITTPGGTAICNAVCGYCTDGVVQSPWEQCDDGNTNNTDACPNTCFYPSPDYDKVFVGWAAVLRPDLVKVPWWGLFQYDYGVGDNWAPGTPVTMNSPAKIRQGAWFTVDPEADPMIGLEIRSLNHSEGREDAYDSGNRSCQDLFRYYGQNSIPPLCEEWPIFDGVDNLTFVGVERPGANHIRIHLEGRARPGCIIGPDDFSSEIDYCVDVELRQQVQGAGQLGPVEYRVTGYHDGFPWHNLVIGKDASSLINPYEYDVCAKGGTLLSLAGGCVDKKVPEALSNWSVVPGTGE